MHMQLATFKFAPPFWRKLFIGFATLLAGDGIWLGVIAKHFGLYTSHIYEKGLGIGAAIFAIALYAIISAAYSALIYPTSLRNAALVGALSGFLVFSAFNITSVAINGKWDANIALIDTLYGTTAWTIMMVLQNQ